MSDFHASIDRALEAMDGSPLASRYFMPEPLENPLGVPPLSGAWVELGYVDEVQEWPRADLIPLMKRINERVAERAMAINAFAVRRSPSYDDSWFPRDTSFLDDFDPNEHIRAMRFYSNAWIGDLMGPMPGTPLCELEVPAEGVE